jgi:hypothetical protein
MRITLCSPHESRIMVWVFGARTACAQTNGDSTQSKERETEFRRWKSAFSMGNLENQKRSTIHQIESV